ncbi:serine/threonine-protein kinase [Streptomyces phyllanthi]|uniref:non-specific serine/threonine protein kinase n=1 Tax=Streptomyces phyllanthi TaxID=1803180 RepID=A0A5N8W0V0_9ACTN|nr:serine/threonine-protein kinase [Streptomyces phyllanthi]MPY41133.1 serine/threonine protein kinase [Streptomyces phyllanthi]
MQGLLLAGRYRLVDTIGSGGMGRVWRARDEVLHRAVAIKELTAALYVTDSDRARLFARTDAEARAAARINHSAVVTVHDVLDHDSRPWIVMELVEGGSLADAVKERGRVEPAEAARIGLWVLRALSAAHQAGVLHRDVKPGNVLLAEDGRVLLTDFGIAQVDGDTTITRTGEIVGSVDYIAPERVRGQDPGPASDLWALGATLYTAVEGRSPFRRTTPLTTMQAVVEEEPVQPVHAGPLGPVITALLRKDPAERPGAAEAERMFAEAAEGRQPHVAQAFVPTQRMGAHQEVHSGTTGLGPEHTATPYPPVTGPTSTGSSTYTPAGAPATRRSKRRLRTLALVLALATIVGGGTAVALRQWDVWQANSASSAPSPSSSPTPTNTGTPAPRGGIPDDWVSVTDPLGFSLYLPEGWERSVHTDEGDLKQIDYSPDSGKHLVRIAVDSSPDFADPYRHQLDLEVQIEKRLVDYTRVSLEANVYRDLRGSLWDYTWTALPKDTDFPGPYRAIEETYIARDGVEYVIYMAGPEKGWDATRKQFDAVLRGWQPPER